MRGLEARSVATRNEALSARRAELDATLRTEMARLAEATRRAQEAHDTAIAAAEDTVARTAAGIDAAIARELVAKLHPLVAQFPDAPRTITARIADTWRALATRAREELGEELAVVQLGVPFLVALGADAVAASGARDFWTGVPLTLAQRAADQIDRADPAALVEQSLRELEIAVSTNTRMYARASSADRARIYFEHASFRRLSLALHAFDAQAEADHLAAFQRTYRGPPEVRKPGSH